MDTVLERLIEEKGYRKGFIAREAGMHPSQLSRLLHSERDPRIDADAAAIIAERLGVPAEVFVDGQRLRMTTDVAEKQQNAPPASPGQTPRVNRPHIRRSGRPRGRPVRNGSKWLTGALSQGCRMTRPATAPATPRPVVCRKCEQGGGALVRVSPKGQPALYQHARCPRKAAR